MAYSDWSRNSTVLNTSYNPTGFPVDFRTLRDTLSEVFSVGSGYRFPGLKTYVVDNGIEYMFTASVSAATGKITFPNNRIQEYHPELAHFKSIDSSSLPQDLPNGVASVRDILNNPASILGDGSFENNGTTYYTIPDGAEGVIKVLDNGGYSYYSYVWNGDTNEWIPFANSGSGGSNAVILNFASDIDVSGDSDSPVYLSSIYALNSNYISNAYKEAMGLDVNDTIASGSEANVVFTDKTTDPYVEYCRKYVYLNGAWRIVQGVQEYVITLPAYVDDEWYDSYNPKNGMVIEPNDDSVNVDVMVASNKGTVDVIISHQFNSQYVDVFVFEKNETSENIDGGATPETPFLLTDLTS